MQWTPVLLSEALLAHDVYVCLERPSGALPPAVALAQQTSDILRLEAAELPQVWGYNPV